MTSMELRSVTVLDDRGEPVLDGLDLVVPAGSTTALCGPAGAGKTAVLRVLVGLDDPAEGEILLDGEDVSASGPRARDVSMVFEDFALHPHLDVHDNLAFATRLRRKHDKVALAESIDEAAAVLALDHLLDDKPAALEAAQRQRVAIGRALVRDARAYLFDDVFSVQPERVRTHVRSVTLQWQRDLGRTSLFATDRPEEALSMAERVAVMHRGVVHQVGTPRELYAEPADLFVAAFCGQPSINLLPARVEGEELVTPLITIPLDVAGREAVGEREQVVVGIRPEHCRPAAEASPDALRITGPVDDLEWRGGSHLVYLGYDLEPEDQELLEQLEDALDFDLFQSFFVADLPAAESVALEQTVSVAVAPEQVLFFDPETGARLTGG